MLNEAFVDYRTRAALRTAADGKTVVVTETEETETTLVVAPDVTTNPPSVEDDTSNPVVTTTDERTAQVSGAALKMKRVIDRRPDAPEITIPLLRMTTVESKFSLADITDTDSFRKLGTALAANPDGELSRTLVGARIVVGPDGVKRTQLVRSEAADHIQSIASLFSLDELRLDLTDIVLASPAVPARRDQIAALQPLLNAFFEGLGSKAEEVLSANLARAAARLIALVNTEQRRFMAKPSYEQVVKLEEFAPVRSTDREFSEDRLGPFSRPLAYEGWKRSLFAVEWFDSEPERRVANMVDADDSVVCWVRLHLKELPILWNSGGQRYNPDLIVIDDDGTHWVVEVKMDKEVASEDVRGKREAAQRWANHVSADEDVHAQWRYILVSETDIKTAKGSWEALKRLGS